LRDCVATMRGAGIEQWDEIYPDAAVIDRDIAGGTLEVMVEHEHIAACITIDRNVDPLWKDLDWSAAGDPCAVVHRLMVHPSYQGRGLAKQFMLHAEAVARTMECRSIRLDSFLQNPAAMALYPRLGYRPTGTASMRKGPFAGFEKLL
jgi:GNAT superfamily N-acetyltransferase